MIKIITTDFKEDRSLPERLSASKSSEHSLSLHLVKKEWFTFQNCQGTHQPCRGCTDLGDKVKVVCLGKDKMGRISFSIKDVPAEAK